MLHAICNTMTEWSLTASRVYADPFADVEVDVVITDPEGETQRLPAFWSGEGTWRVRFAATRPGRHRWRSECTEADDGGLHGVEGELEAAAYEGDNALLRHGPLRVSKDRRYLEHRDGTPFPWLADTWWMAFSDRLAWPDGFQTLTRDRVDKGFTVVQLVAGLFPDMGAFDERGRNACGFAWEEDFTRINPDYFDAADLRLAHLVRAGLVPCIVGCWGYYLPWLGPDKMRRHWRYLVARYGAWPVVWCLAGEGTMPYYLSDTKDEDRETQLQGWTEMARYVRDIDPYGHPLTIHPSTSARETVADAGVLDFDMLQTGHGDRGSLANTVRRVQEAYATEPVMPVLNSEVCYEGIGEACRQEVQRLMYWSCVLSGACGHTYGANGIWQVNDREHPYGPSPHGMAWGHTPWEDAYKLPGSGQLGLSKGLLTRYAWWAFVPHPEWVTPTATPEDPRGAYAAGIPGQVRVAFLPSGVWGVTVHDLEPETGYRAFLFSPVDGHEIDLGTVRVAADGTWQPPPERPPIFQDWVLVLEAADARQPQEN